MSNFAILRTQKIHTTAKIVAADMHNLRVWQPENANPDGKNFRVFGDRDSLKTHNNILKKYDIKPRKNGVLAIEYIASFSPEMKAQMNLKDWVNQNVAFFRKHHGEGLMAVDLHLDESNPHLHITATPIIKKEIRGEKVMRLSARDFLGGKQMLIELQDNYAKKMAKFGLERGVVGSRAHHTSVKTYYKNLNNQLEKAEAFAKKESNFEQPNFLNFKKIFNKIRKDFKAVTKRLGVALGKIDDQTKRIKLLKAENAYLNQQMHHSGVDKLKNTLAAANARVDSLESDLIALDDLNNKMDADAKATLKEKDNMITVQQNYIEKQSHRLNKYENGLTY